MGKSKDDFIQMRQSDIKENMSEGIPMHHTAPNTVSPSVQVEIGFKALVSLDAASIDTLARAKVNEVAEGNLDAAKLFALGQKISLLGTTIVDNVKNYVYGKTYATKGETYTIDGVELTPSALGTKYNYSGTGDKQWEELNSQFEAIKKAKEDREKFLKTIKDKLDIYDPETSEVYTIQAPIKTETQGYKSKVK